MRGAGDISIKIKDHIIQHCVTNDLDLHDFLERKGGVALIKLIPELAGYTVQQVNAALKLPTLKGRKPTAKKPTSDNKDDDGDVENEENVDVAEGRKPKAKKSTSSNVHANNNKNKVRTKSSKTKNALAIDQLSTADILSAAAFHEKVILQDLLKQGNFPENHEIFNHVKVLCSMVRSLASTSQSDLQLK